MQAQTIPMSGGLTIQTPRTILNLAAGGLAGLLIWEVFARVVTKAMLGYPLEPAGLIDGIFNLAHPAGIQHAGESPTLSHQELMDAALAAPSARPAAASSAKAISAGDGGDSFATSSTPSSALAALAPYDSFDLGPSEQQISTGTCSSRQQLRQEVASRLDQVEGRSALRIRIGIAFDSRAAEMSTLPTFLRGSLTGSGTFSGETTLEFVGPFTKAAVEAMIERLPDFSPGCAKVTLTLGA